MVNDFNEKDNEPVITERVVKISRVAKVVKGGRHLSFSAMVVVGDGEGSVGIGLGKAEAVPDAVKKGSTEAQKTLMQVPLKNTTIPHEVTAKSGASTVKLMPGTIGTGVKAGGAVRAVVELLGVRDILTKIISEKYSESNLENLPKTAAFFSEKNEIINDNYKLKDKEFISIIPPIGGG